MIEFPRITRNPNAKQSRLGIYLAIAFAAILVIRALAVFWTDYLWYESVGQTSVWFTLVFTKVWLILGAFVVAFGVIFLNMWAVDRISPAVPPHPDDVDAELVERYQEWVLPRARKFRLGISTFLGGMVALGAGAYWREWLSFRASESFGIADPIFGNDVSRYVFELPFFRAAFGWVFQLLIVTALIAAALHYFNGAIQVASGRGVSSGVKMHLSLIFAVIALTKAFGYLFDQWSLVYSERGGVFGVSYTDFNAQRPALNLLIFISIIAAIILVANVFMRGWMLPVVALALWLFTSIVVGGIYPAFIQRFRVDPEAVTREAPFVQNNIDFTRQAYNLADVEVRPFAASPNLTGADIAANRATVDNIRLWDPSVLEPTYRKLQEIRTFYSLPDVDIDRYVVDGELTQVMIAGRELDEENLPAEGWVTETSVFTHGFGAVLSPANAVAQGGQPAFFVQDIPPTTTDEIFRIDEPRIYFGDRSQSRYKIVNTDEPEADFPDDIRGDRIVYGSYTGKAGVQLSSVFRRAAFATRFLNLDTLIAGQIRSDSRLLMVRNVRDRVARIAPFLSSDDDPYLVVFNGRLIWVVDLYTTTNQYPFSQRAETGRLSREGRRSSLPEDFNYIRNSVKATVDAESGVVNLYIIDPDDPLIRSQQRIFPGLFKDASQIPAGLEEHFRYPEGMFRVQSDMYLKYHISDPKEFFSLVDPWQIARDPSDSSTEQFRDPAFNRTAANPNAARPMSPYYLLLELPEEDKLSFILMQPFTPAERPNMVAFLVAKSDPGEYGELIVYTLPADSSSNGPGQVGDFINQNTEISAQFTLWGQTGSRVVKGAMQVVPVNESLLYVQPIFLRADSPSGTTPGGDAGGIPEFKQIVVSFDGEIVMRESLDEALSVIFGDTGTRVEPVEPGTTPPPTTTPGEMPEVSALLDQAQQAFDDANVALRDGDLAGYADKVQLAQDLVNQAADLLNGG